MNSSPSDNPCEIDPVFADDEQLFRRFGEDDIDDFGRIEPGSIRLPECSFDRSKYSSLESVLKDDESTGVYSVLCSQIPRELSRAEESVYTSVIVHVPVKLDGKWNNAHSEVRVHKNGNRIKNRPKKSKVYQQATETLRLAIVESLVIERPPA